MQTLRFLRGYHVIALIGIAITAINSAAQDVFRIGSWCLRGGQSIDQIIEAIPPGSENWYLRAAEKTKLDNLGLNFFIACTGDPTTTNGEEAMNNFGIERGGAFRTNMSVSPPNASSGTAYAVWRAIDWATGGPGNTTWENYVNNGYASMNTFYTDKTGVHSFLVGAEHQLDNPARYPWLQYMCNSVHVNAPGVLTLVEGGQPPDLNAFFQAVPSIDVYENGYYPFITGLPFTGSPFQSELQT